MIESSTCGIILKILNSLPIGIGIFDNSKKLLLSNEEFKKLLRSIENQEIFFKDPPAINELFISSINKITGFSSYRTPHGWFVITKDITGKHTDASEDRKILELLDHLFSMVRHEVGNPINTIKFSLSVMKEDIDSFSKEKLLEYINRLLEEIEQLEEILRAMKRYSNYGYVVTKKVNLNETLGKVLRIMENEILMKDINLKSRLPSEEISVKADPTALSQVLTNLLKNSIEALEEYDGSPKTIEVFVKTDEEFARIYIKDTGPGIPEEIKDKIFFPFFSTKKNGSGMGLTISKGLITAMDGKLDIRNHPNGAIAEVSLKLWK